MDPYLLQQVMAAAAQNPEMFAKMMAGMNIPPPTGGMQVPTADTGTVPMEAPAQAPSMVAPAAAPVSAPSPAPAPDPMLGKGGTPMGGDLGALMQMGAIAGRGAPASADTKPIMSGGLSNSQRAPEAGKMAGGSSAASYDMILKLLGGGGPSPLRVPQLGALMGR